MSIWKGNFIKKIFCILHRYILPQYGKIEALIGKELPEYPTVKDEVMVLVDRVKEAQLLATKVCLIIYLLLVKLCLNSTL